MDHALLGASVAYGGMLLVCAFTEIRDRRRIAQRRAIFGGAR